MTRGSGPDWDSGGELLDGEEGERGELEEGCIVVRQSKAGSRELCTEREA